VRSYIMTLTIPDNKLTLKMLSGPSVLENLSGLGWQSVWSDKLK
jgi:hypothetical protein